MTLTTCDFILLAVTAAAALLGAFGGVSGALAFVAGLAGAGAAVHFGWTFVTQFVASDWGRILLTLVVALLAFGLARMLVKRCVGRLLAQPADAIFGGLVGASAAFASGLAILAAAVRFQFLTDGASELLRMIHGLVG